MRVNYYSIQQILYCIYFHNNYGYIYHCQQGQHQTDFGTKCFTWGLHVNYGILKYKLYGW